jgi:histidinol phosphatase-like enzyme (inositol monophosphatase family)
VEAFIRAATEALDAAGAAIRPHFRTRVIAEQKSDASPVTVADRNAEQVLRATLSRYFPTHGFIGEEFPATAATSRYTWVIDPIDGTRAFITGRPSFCTLLALLEDEVPILGFIDQPITRERWSGGRDVAPGFMNPLGGVIGPRATTCLAEAELSSTAPEMFGAAHLEQFRMLQAACRRTYWGGDAYAYGLLALGHIDVIAEANLKPWDWAAIVPILTAAGAVITDWSGDALHLKSDGTVLAAGNKALHEEARKQLRL